MFFSSFFFFFFLLSFRSDSRAVCGGSSWRVHEPTIERVSEREKERERERVAYVPEGRRHWCQFRKTHGSRDELNVPLSSCLLRWPHVRYVRARGTAQLRAAGVTEVAARWPRTCFVVCVLLFGEWLHGLYCGFAAFRR